jgi:hypothetical protein
MAVAAISRLVAVSIINSRWSLDDLGLELPGKMWDVLERHGWKRSESSLRS